MAVGGFLGNPSQPAWDGFGEELSREGFGNFSKTRIKGYGSEGCAPSRNAPPPTPCELHLGISLEMLLKLVRIFGSVIHSTLSASSSVGVDIQAEQRLERCNLCFIELEKIKHCLPALTRRGGSVAKLAQELNLALLEVL
ncbi:Katanin p80 WD40 repeat-containing subunit B1-like [Vitis vinifera]|uniref:Katanin p80 WD40 repeat-containing subunit B1-like n=1 Tax=Vitis vinifera TaxID=29760 RepID=A0A438EU21_VITVI|nr:Katanin p80 WD40 repeat-containing subunit B1-like [Vitis vinifera]RVX16163.1 Katanin p80 WD40 repeat-containing subunit B1-like [Vitis vinifera]